MKMAILAILAVLFGMGMVATSPAVAGDYAYFWEEAQKAAQLIEQNYRNPPPPECSMPQYLALPFWQVDSRLIDACIKSINLQGRCVDYNSFEKGHTTMAQVIGANSEEACRSIRICQSHFGKSERWCVQDYVWHMPSS